MQEGSRDFETERQKDKETFRDYSIETGCPSAERIYTSLIASMSFTCEIRFLLKYLILAISEFYLLNRYLPDHL